MNDQTAVEVANAHLVSAGLAIDGMTPVVENPASHEVEVAFTSTTEDDLVEVAPPHRVFMSQEGEFLGLVLADGSQPACTSASDLVRVKGEEPIEAAPRYLQAHGVDTLNLVGRVVDPTQLVCVWYKEGEMFGGGFEVYMTECGTVVRWLRGR